MVCPFCGSRETGDASQKRNKFIHKTVNLEAGRPLLDVALRRLSEVIEDAVRNNVSALTLIHGYGSSGKGGVIRSECRKTLEYLKSKNQIRDYVKGEDFNKKTGLVKSILQRYPQLGSHNNLNRANRGITLVIFSYILLLLPTLVYSTNLYTTFLSMS